MVTGIVRIAGHCDHLFITLWNYLWQFAIAIALTRYTTSHSLPCGSGLRPATPGSEPKYLTEKFLTDKTPSLQAPYNSQTNLDKTTSMVDRKKHPHICSRLQRRWNSQEYYCFVYEDAMAKAITSNTPEIFKRLAIKIIKPIHI